MKKNGHAPGSGSPWAAGPAKNGKRAAKASRAVVVTGGAGFIGTNLVHRLLCDGERVMIFDNLSRRGAEKNLRWLRDSHGDNLQVDFADVRDYCALRRAVRDAQQVFHFAAQVAVTTSLTDPRHDFDVNASGTLNLLEALRAADDPAPLIFTSTNKVYGGLDDIELEIAEDAYHPVDPALRQRGISEARPLDLHSPYGCSKGAADEYILDYARTFGLSAVVFRMSCIYGPHQFGNEDQGWVAHFLISALENRPLTIYGDGRQVRDLLYVDDLVEAFLLARAQHRTLSGQPFNIGGGPQHAMSLRDLLSVITGLEGAPPSHAFAAWRTGDQRYYVSDTSKFEAATGWRAKVAPAEGIARLYDWLRRSRAGRLRAPLRRSAAPCAIGSGARKVLRQDVKSIH